MEFTAIQQEAFNWIIGILQKHQIPFQVSGGLAARAYNANRPLNDIDIDIPNEFFPVIMEDVLPFVTHRLARYVDADWDLLLMTLSRNGQSIDLSGMDDVRIYDKAANVWVKIPSNLEKRVIREVMGIQVPVINPHELIAYKERLNRSINGHAIDKEDAVAVRNFISSEKLP